MRLEGVSSNLSCKMGGEFNSFHRWPCLFPDQCPVCRYDSPQVPLRDGIIILRAGEPVRLLIHSYWCAKTLGIAIENTQHNLSIVADEDEWNFHAQGFVSLFSLGPVSPHGVPRVAK